MKLREEPVESGGDFAPILQPFAREPQRDLGGIERTLVDAGARHRADRPRTAGEELLGFVREIDEVLALIGRAGSEGDDGEPVRAGRRLRLDIARIDGAQPRRRRDHRAEAGNRHEEAIVCVCGNGVFVVRDRLRGAGFAAGCRGCERRPQKNEVDPLVGPGMTLHRRPDRRGRYVEKHARDRDRDGRRIERGRRFWPSGPQHVGNKGSHTGDKENGEGERQQRAARLSK